MTFNGVIKKLFAYKESNGWCSGVIQLDNGTMKFAGLIPGAIVGNKIEFEGEIVETESYGKQIKIKSLKTNKLVQKSGTIKALMLYDGIGEKMANNIYDKFGDKSLNILQKTPDKLLEVKGITENKLEKIKNTKPVNKTVQKIITESNGNISENLANKIVKEYGKNANKKVKENPYKLIKDFKNIGFKKADKVALGVGVNLLDKKRIRATLISILQEESHTNGHMYLTDYYLQGQFLSKICDFSSIKLSSQRKQNQFLKYMTIDFQDYIKDKETIDKKLGFDELQQEFVDNWVDTANQAIAILSEALVDAAAEGDIYIDPNNNIYERVSYESEDFLSNMIGVLAKKDTVKKIDPLKIHAKIAEEEVASGYALGDEQKEAINTSLRSRISVITGGPGRGKTTIINTIIKIWDDDENIILCAPTGRAAQRMKEQTGHQADTIHSLVYNTSFTSVENKLFIVDESSMIDIDLGASLLYVIMSGENNVIFVGDADQLPSIGAGNFFNDLINSKAIPTTFLKKGYRNFGHIADNAYKINIGCGFNKMVQGDDFIFTNCEKEILQNNIIEEYGKLLTKFSPKDICILSPMRTRSSSGCDKINSLIRNKYNPNANDRKYANIKFAPNDRVICTKNMRNKEVVLNGAKTTGVFNGDCGTVVNADTVNYIIEIEFDDGKTGTFNQSELNNFTFAYAVTIHKSQGSEYKAVILAVTTEHFVLLQRNLLYTAVTRAKNLVHIYGTSKAFNMAIRNIDYKLRNSRFRSKLLKIVNNNTLTQQDITKIIADSRMRYRRFVMKKGELNY